MPNLYSNPNFVSRLEEWKLRGRPTQNAMDWNLDRWTEEFPEYKDFLEHLYIGKLGYLDREYLQQVVSQENENGNPINGFLAVMIWGYGPDPRGPFRTRRIIDQPQISEALNSTLDALEKENISVAFSALVTNGPKYLGAAFATKYLFFASTENSEFTPLILDSLVSEALQFWGDYRVNSQTKNAGEYVGYLNYMQACSEHLDLSMSELEMVLFTEFARLKGNQSWANRQVISRLDDRQIFLWGFLFASELMLRISSLNLSYTEPCGGQYKCLSLRSSDASNFMEFDINLVGSIHIRASKHLKIEWEDLIKQGPTATAETICRYLAFDSKVNIESSSKQGIAFRALASSLIDNFDRVKMEVFPVMVDNSVYGVSINKKLLSPYDSLEIYKNDSELVEHAKFLWAVLINGEPSRLVNSITGDVFRTDGTVLSLSWP